MAASSDGARLYVVDSARGMVSVMDTGTLEILRTEEIDLRAAAVTGTSAKFSADDGTLFVGTSSTAEVSA